VAYRQESPGELCARCDQPAPEACARCTTPYCEAHSPQIDRRCDPCESEYLSRETRRIRKVVVTLVVIAGVVGFIGVIATHAARNGYIRGPYAHLAPLILYAALAAMAAVFALPPVLRNSLRRRFLAETRSPKEAQPGTSALR
jgi:hypothetical protein